ncbi:MAG: LON peptidase substrate-binding domain-containing protein [Phycisphaeraceae bacterium]|nr:LON peptidase substrate-binding domain-containing protein [Phycisphaeraceae bacterium]
MTGDDFDPTDALPPDDDDEPVLVRINFGKPIPLFPLHKTLLLPLEVAQIRFFEPRYLSMFEREVLDGPGIIAVATFEGDRWKQEYHGRPPVRPAVCIGAVLRHVKNPDGTYDVLIQGLCRAKIEFELPPDGDRQYRTAILSPLVDHSEPNLGVLGKIESPDDAIEPDADAADPLVPHRKRIASMLSSEPLSGLRDADSFIEHLEQPRIPSAVIVELLGDAVLSTEGSDKRYEFLAEPSAVRRAQQVEGSLERLAHMLRRAQPQRSLPAEKGCHWN